MGKYYTVRLEDLKNYDSRYECYKLVRDKIYLDMCDVDSTTVRYNSPMIYTPSKNDASIYDSVLGIRNIWEYTDIKRNIFGKETGKVVKEKRPFPIIFTIENNSFQELITGKEFEMDIRCENNKIVYSEPSKLTLHRAGSYNPKDIEKLLRLLDDESIEKYINGINKLEEYLNEFTSLYEKRVNPEEIAEEYIKSLREKYSK